MCNRFHGFRGLVNTVNSGDQEVDDDIMVGIGILGPTIIDKSGYFHSLFRVPVKHSVES